MTRTIGQRITTTAGEAFELADVEVMAALIYKRFGYDRTSAAAAYRRLLGNSCPDEDFVILAQRALAHVRSGKHRVNAMIIKILPIDGGVRSVPGKLADAELHFTNEDGLLNGLKLLGFGVWQKKTGGFNVTFPARSYSINGERRSFALLRPLAATSANDAIHSAIVSAYIAHVE